MALIKRGKTWHTHFFVDGQRFRQSLETTDWREAQAKREGTHRKGFARKACASESAVLEVERFRCA